MELTLVYLVAPLILIAIVVASLWLERFSVPIILIALMAGVLFGTLGPDIALLDDMRFVREIADFALVFILFNGGLLTDRNDFKAVALPATGLATWGVVLTALVTFVILHYMVHVPRELALLLAVIISSTDAAAIFAILRNQALPPKLSSMIEIESAANDPMAILLTVGAVTLVTTSDALGVGQITTLAYQFLAGPVIGYAVALVALWLFNKLTPQDRGFYYLLFLGVVLFTYGLAQVVGASGMLAVFCAGFCMGNRPFVHKQGVLNFSESLSIMANVGLFVMLGMLAGPDGGAEYWWKGLLLFVILTFVSRPVAVFLGTMGMKLGWKNQLFTSWAGLRGAIPIVLATYPAAAGIPYGQEIFKLVFIAVICSILVQGSTMGVLAKWLGLSAPARPPQLFHLEMITMAHTDYDLIAVEIPGEQGGPGVRIRDLKLPEGSVITLVTRNREVVVPKGNTCLQPWDRVTVLAHAPDVPAVEEALSLPFLEPYEGQPCGCDDDDVLQSGECV